MADSSSARVNVRSEDLSAEIDATGAQLWSLKDREGRDLLWKGDAKVWASRAPLLFPIVGTLAGGHYRLGSKPFALSRHGFARGKPFQLVSHTSSKAVFRLVSDDSTLAVYPFAFELDVSFELQAATLGVTASVRNTGRETLFASIGFHPAFQWPLPYGEERAAHFIEFERDEPAPVRRIDSDGLLTSELHPTPVVQRRLPLADDLFRNDVLIFDEFASGSVSYGAPRGPRIEVRFPDATYLGLWTKPGAEFICIEPWQGVSDPAGFAGQLHEKPGIFSVAPGSSHSTHMAITLLGT
jgi:galactose mutarotase-like enzyme